MTHPPVASERVSVVVAADGASPAVRESVDGFVREVRGRGEVVLVDATDDGVPTLGIDGVRILRREPGTLTPRLWRDGILATSSEYVAVTTAQMVPGLGWLDSLTAPFAGHDVSGVGGPIDPSGRLGPLDRAVYVQRYVAYGLPWNGSPPAAPPGENAVYRRAVLDRVKESWSEGFWEAEVHRALRGRGEGLMLTPDAPVSYTGGSSLGPLLRQRFRHARRYGAGRAARTGAGERVARTALGPAVPLVMLARAGRRLMKRREPVSRWAVALPALSLVLAAWTWGEVVGTWFGAETRAGDAGDRRHARRVRIEGRS